MKIIIGDPSKVDFPYNIDASINPKDVIEVLNKNKENVEFTFTRRGERVEIELDQSLKGETLDLIVSPIKFFKQIPPDFLGYNQILFSLRHFNEEPLSTELAGIFNSKKIGAEEIALKRGRLETNFPFTLDEDNRLVVGSFWHKYLFLEYLTASVQVLSTRLPVRLESALSHNRLIVFQGEDTPEVSVTAQESELNPIHSASDPFFGAVKVFNTREANIEVSRS